MTERAIVSASPNAFLLPVNANANQRKRLLPFIQWLNEYGEHWLAPNLADLLTYYRDDAFSNEKAAQSVHAYLSTIRSRYHELLGKPETRDLLFREYAQAGAAIQAGMSAREYVEERLTRLRHALDPATVPVKVPKKGDRTHLRLTASEANMLLNSPDRSRRGERDRAIIATLLCTGIRVFELVALNRADLYDHYEGYPALHVREGKGLKERRVLYGELEWFRRDVEAWMGSVQITDGAVFRRLYTNGRAGAEPLTTQAVADILDSYPIMVGGEAVRVDPHDLRRTYARRCYEAGMKVEAIAANMGHADIRTTWRYIGDLKADARLPRGNVYG